MGDDESRLKENYYWAFKLRSRAETLVPPVLESIPFLRDDMKKASRPHPPDNLIHFQLDYFVQTG
jgi:hypothetical protein